MTRIVISDPKVGKAYQIEPEESEFRELVGLTVGETFDGDRIGLANYKLQITGGSDQEGFPMRADVKSERRVRTILSGGTGYKPEDEGMRRRKTVRGNKVSAQIAQLNTKVVEKGEQSIEKLLGLESEEVEEEVESGSEEE